MTKLKEAHGRYNILYALEIINNFNDYFIVMPHADAGDLTSFILAHSIKTEIEAMEYFRQICYGMMILHSIGVIHRDIKTDNVLMCKYNDPSYKLPYLLFIADFGISKEIESMSNTM